MGKRSVRPAVEDILNGIHYECRKTFDWRNLHRYFPFSDLLSEGDYDATLSTVLSQISDESERETLLDALDLQYVVLLEQAWLRENILRDKNGRMEDIRNQEAIENALERGHEAFGRMHCQEVLMAYLQINANRRSESSRKFKNARQALFRIPPGTLVSRLLGYGGDDDS